MISRRELIDMIATESIESIESSDQKISRISYEELPDMKYDLRLVRYEDGRMEWRD